MLLLITPCYFIIYFDDIYFRDIFAAIIAAIAVTPLLISRHAIHYAITPLRHYAAIITLMPLRYAALHYYYAITSNILLLSLRHYCH